MAANMKIRLAFRQVAGGGLLIFAVLLGLLGRLGPGYLDRAMRAGIRDRIVLSPDMDPALLNAWRDSKWDPQNPPIHRRYTFFNITNPEEVRAGLPPRVTRVGPLSYHMRQRALDPTFSEDKSRVTYLAWTTMHESPDLDVSLLDAPITTPNLSLISIVKTLQRRYYNHPTLVGWILKQLVGWLDKSHCHGTLMTRPAREVLWGYEDPLLQRVKRWLPDVSPRLALERNMTEAELRNTTMPDALLTGARDLAAVRRLVQWNGMTALDVWRSDCVGCPASEPVRGSTGAQWPPGMKDGRSAKLALWIREGFRAVDLRFAGHVDREGIPLIRFTDDPSVWARNDHFYQGIQGMWNITEPFSRLTLQRSSDSAAPPTVPVQLPMLYISRKGYCHVRPEDLPQVEGLDGCSDPVSTALIDIEPTTGITMGARQVFVLSTQLEPYNQIDPAVAPSIVPIMEVEVESAITPELARKFRDGLERVWLVRKALVSIVPGVAIALALTGTALVVPWPEGRQRRALGRWERITQAHRASQSASAGPSGAGADGDARGGARVPAVRRGGLAALRQKLGAKILGLRSRSWRRRRNVDLQDSLLDAHARDLERGDDVAAGSGRAGEGGASASAGPGSGAQGGDWDRRREPPRGWGRAGADGGASSRTLAPVGEEEGLGDSTGPDRARGGGRRAGEVAGQGEEDDAFLWRLSGMGDTVHSGVLAVGRGEEESAASRGGGGDAVEGLDAMDDPGTPFESPTGSRATHTRTHTMENVTDRESPF